MSDDHSGKDKKGVGRTDITARGKKVTIAGRDINYNFLLDASALEWLKKHPDSSCYEIVRAISLMKQKPEKFEEVGKLLYDDGKEFCDKVIPAVNDCNDYYQEKKTQVDGLYDKILNSANELEELNKDEKVLVQEIHDHAQKLNKFIPTLLGATLRAKSLSASCDASAAEKRSLRKFSKRGEKEFVFFLSAVTNQPGTNQRTVEYQVAEKLTEAFKAKNIKYFWWKDAARLRLPGKNNSIGKDWLISTKIAAGLAFSSVFIGLAFDPDTVERNADGTCEYKYLLTGDDNNFKYETNTFISLMSGARNGKVIENTKYARAFTEGIVAKYNFKRLVPQKRYFTFFTTGKPKQYERYCVLQCSAEKDGANKKGKDTEQSAPQADPADVSEGKFFKSRKKRAKAGSEPLYYFHELDNEEGQRLFVKDDREFSGQEDKIRALAQFVYDNVVELIVNDKKLQYLCGFQQYNDDKELLRKVLKYTFQKETAPLHFRPFPYDTEKDAKIYGKILPEGERGGDPVRVDLPEDACAVPSDYHFEYAVRDEQGFSAKRHFTFFPESYCDQNGAIRWRIKAVIKDWNYAFIADERLRKEAFGIKDEEGEFAIPEEVLKSYPLIQYKDVSFGLGGNELQSIDYKEYSKAIVGNGTITVWDENISKSHGFNDICGTLNFPGHGKPKKSYYFDIIFAPKRIVFYRIEPSEEGKVSFVIKDKQKAVENICVKVAVASSADHQSYACLKDDQCNICCLVKELEGQTFDSGFSYSLRPYSGYEKYYVFLEEREEGKADGQNAKNAKPSLRRCPLCGKFLTTDIKADDRCYPFSEGGGKGELFCQHNYVHAYWDSKAHNRNEQNIKKGQPQNDNGSQDGFGNIIKIELSKDNNAETKENAIDKEKDAAQREFAIEPIPKADPGQKYRLTLPKGLAQDKVAVVSLLGLSKAGKSTFLSGLFRNGGEAPDCSQIGSKLSSFVKNVRFCGIDSEEPHNGAKAESNGGISWEMLKSAYNVKLYSDFVAPTSNIIGKRAVISHIPYMMQLNEIQGTSTNAYLSFFDTPGGLFFDDDTNSTPFKVGSRDLTMVYRSDCLVLLVNGAPKSEDAIDLEKSMSILNAILEKLSEKEREEYTRKTALAVLLCKFDELAENFDANSYVRSSPPIMRSRNFGGSSIHYYIDRCSEEIENYIKRKNSQSDFFNSVNRFSNRKYFAVSSIGRSDSIISTGNGYKTAFFSQPKNIENVLLWIMYKTGIII